MLAKIEDTENLLGHGEVTAPVIYVKNMSNGSNPLCKKALDLADERFPRGYILIAHPETSCFDLGYLTGLLFDSQESDKIISSNDTHFILKDTSTKSESRGVRRIEYPKVKGLIVTPASRFQTSGHHLEGIIESNTLGFSTDVDLLQHASLFHSPEEVTEDNKTYNIWVSKKPLRMAVDGQNRRAILPR